VSTIINPPVPKFGQGVFHDALQTFFFDMVDMHTPDLNIEEDMKFPKVLVVKQILKL
jgi:hypothetical protein